MGHVAGEPNGENLAEVESLLPSECSGVKNYYYIGAKGVTGETA